MSPRLVTADPRTARGQSAFTLLEIMVAMVVLTLIVTAAFGALRLGERSWESGLNHSAETETLRTVSGVLQRLVNQALPISWQANSRTVLAFEGERQRLRFIGPAPRHGGATGLFEYTLAQDPTASNQRLMLYYRLHDPDQQGFADDDSEWQEVILVEEVRAVDFAFYGATTAQQQPEWHSQWPGDAENFPRLVRVRLDPAEAGAPWPELQLALYTVPAT